MTTRPPPGPRCPVCARPTLAEHAPFCSRGCRDRDLLAWFSEDYRLPVREPDGGLDTGVDSGGEPD